jgi:ABC transporter transmembrane region
VIGGIKTVSSLCAETWAVNKYEGMAREAQKHSIYAGILAKFAVGIMGVLFYATYCIAFIFGT